MSYEVVLQPEAISDLASLPLPVQNAVEQNLNRLANDPPGHSRPSAFPYPPCQISQFHLDDVDGIDWYITILFRYSSSEEEIRVIAIGHTWEEFKRPTDP